MRAILYILRHLISILALPGIVMVAVPAIIIHSGRANHPAWTQPTPWNILLIGVGAAFLASGVYGVAATVWLFARRGQGTLAPWDPPTRLVVEGIYRHLRNPMIGSGLLGLLGAVILSGCLALFVYWGAVLLVNMIYIPLLEEPGLERRFGEEYRRYKRCVPRWIPRWTAWDGK